jgi:exodeoxyribonuclease VII small subunit
LFRKPKGTLQSEDGLVAKKKNEPFEDALKRLQAIVERLERGDLPLEEAMQSFTEGIRLAHFCHSKLEEAENMVQMLTKDQHGSWDTKPFEGSAANGSSE